MPGILAIFPPFYRAPGTPCQTVWICMDVEFWTGVVGGSPRHPHHLHFATLARIPQQRPAHVVHQLVSLTFF